MRPFVKSDKTFDTTSRAFHVFYFVYYEGM